MCIDSAEICFGIDDGQIPSIFVLSARDTSVFLFLADDLSKVNGVSPNLVYALI